MLKSEENLVEARLTAAAYMSLREEGKTQVTTESLFARLELLDRMATFWPSVKDNSHCRIKLLAEYCEKTPAPTPLRCAKWWRWSCKGLVASEFASGPARRRQRQDVALRPLRQFG